MGQRKIIIFIHQLILMLIGVLVFGAPDPSNNPSSGNGRHSSLVVQAFSTSSSSSPINGVGNGGTTDGGKLPVTSRQMPPIPSINTDTTTTTTTTALTVSDCIPLAQKAIEYFDASTDPFHAVQSSINILQQAGFVEYDETSLDDGPSLQPNGKYYYTKNKSTLVAFAIGGQFSSTSRGGFVIIGGHTDSPNLRIKPRSKRTSAGYIQLGVECYGGGLWHTWFDRDLGISGRVFIRSLDPNTQHERMEQKLIRINRPLLRISNLAIHLQTAEERKAFTINNEDHLSPILALEVTKALTTGGSSTSGDDATIVPKTATETTNNGWIEHQEPALLKILANELGCTTADIIDFELNLFDVQQGTLGGAFSEFIYSSRLDNLASCFMAVEALSGISNEQLEQSSDVSMIVLYDHEEVGSTSAVGAASPVLEEAIDTISNTFVPEGTSSVASSTIVKRWKKYSFVLSSDQAHAVHPNYVSKHEKNHQPKMNAGMVIKRNSNQRYATNPVGGVLIREIARRAGNIPAPQEFMVRQDCGCGSTIGPTISARTGIRTIDMGCPQLSMHSIREIMGTKDITNGYHLFQAYFHYFRTVDTLLEQ